MGRLPIVLATCCSEALLHGRSNFARSAHFPPARRPRSHIKESHHLQFRVEAFNLFNTPQFAGPNANLGDAAFGRITTTTIDNREVQFALKYSF